VPSGALTTTPVSVATSAVQVVAEAPNVNINGNGTYTNASPASLMYAAADGTNNVHIYGVNLANASNSANVPTATQISSVSLPITAGAAISTVICPDSSSLSGSTNALDPTTLFVVLHLPGSGGCNNNAGGDTWEIVHYADSASTAPVPLTTVTAFTNSSSTASVFEPLYQPGGNLAGIVVLDVGTNNLQLFSDDTFASPTTLVASATAASVLYDSGRVGLGTNLFLNVTSAGQAAVYRIPYSYSGGAATAAYTYQATTTPVTAAVADDGNVYFTDTALGTPFTPGAVSGSGSLHFGGGTVGNLTTTGTGAISGNTMTLTLTDNNVNQGGTQNIAETDVLTGTYSGGTFTATGGTYEYTSCTDVVNSICASQSEGPLNTPAAFDSVSGTVTVSGGTLTLQRTAASPRVVTMESYTFAAGAGGGAGPAYLIEQLPLSGGAATAILSASTAFDNLLGADGSVVVFYTASGSNTTLYTTPVNATAPASSAPALGSAFTGTFSALTTFMKPTTPGDATTSLIYVTADNVGSYSSEVLSTSGAVKQPLAANSAFLNALPSFLTGSVLQVQGITGTGFGGGSIFDVDPTTLTGSAAGGTVLKSNGAAYTISAGDTVGLFGLSSTIGSGFEQPAGGGTSIGLAYDLSQNLIAPISIANTSVTPE
jgi:hypothetical protein